MASIQFILFNFRLCSIVPNVKIKIFELRHNFPKSFYDILGRSVNIPGMGHAHLQFGEIAKNFSHRINGLTFGDRIDGMLYALDGEEKKAPIADYSYQYYVQVRVEIQF